MNQVPIFFAGKNGGAVVQVICGDAGEVQCCGETLTKLTANTSEGAAEKHLPVVDRSGSEITVKVGSIYHPMTEEHSIGWVYLETKKGGQRICLCPDEEPVARFCVAQGDAPVAAYAYCNLHGFWKTDIH